MDKRRNKVGPVLKVPVETSFGDPHAFYDVISATLGVIYSVPTDALPKESRLTWNLFSPKMQVVRAASTDEAGPLPYKLRPDDNVLVWKNFLKNPTIPGLKPLPEPEQLVAQVPLASILSFALLTPIALILHRKKGVRVGGYGFMAVLLFGVAALLVVPNVAVPLPMNKPFDAEEQKELVSGLLANVYSFFDFSEEEAVYDALDQSLSGELLNQVYLETMKSLELASQGGAREG
jgi:hypothetical protein